MEHFGGIGDQMLSVLVDRGQCPHSILPHVGMSVVEAGLCRGEERFDQLGLMKFGEESQGIASYELVGMLQVVPDTVTRCVSVSPLCAVARLALVPDQDHFLFQFPVAVQLRTDFIVEI